LRFGLVTDTHYADADARGTRHYRESIEKLRECIACMNDNNVEFLAELGDFKDELTRHEEASTLGFLRTIEGVFATYDGRRHYVLGNHDMDSISKAQFIAATGLTRPYDSFDAGDYHFVILDANHTAAGRDYDHGDFDWTDANIPPDELGWLADDLAKTGRPTIVFCHQRLDGTGDVFVRNAEEVRRTLESSKKVLGVFQGHDHAGDHRRMGGIHYYTLRAVVEGSGEQNNSYAIVEVYPGGAMTVTGYRRAVGKELLPGSQRVG